MLILIVGSFLLAIDGGIGEQRIHVFVRRPERPRAANLPIFPKSRDSHFHESNWRIQLLPLRSVHQVHGTSRWLSCVEIIFTQYGCVGETSFRASLDITP